MKKIKETGLLKFAFLGVMWAIGACILAGIITSITLFKFNDVLFIEGLILFGIGILSSISEEELCGSLKGVGGFNCQYISDEFQSVRNKNRIIRFDASSINLDVIIGGAISLLMLLI
jgi:hypothetical protein